jgi:adenylosuccinate lyase
MQKNNSLMAVSPVDGRYKSKTEALSPYLSEFGLIHYRVKIEVEYIIALAQAGLSAVQPLLLDDNKNSLRNIVDSFDLNDAQWIKDQEAITNHDVKAVEYFVKSKMEEIGLSNLREFVHFGLTSQDINNTAIPLSLLNATENSTLPLLDKVVDAISERAKEWNDQPMLARTHGQPASPTRLGKELYVFVARVEEQIRQFKDIEWPAKFGGATGNFNAHNVAYPEISWANFADSFCESLGLKRSEPTTQIEHYDNLAAKFDALKRINVILIDFCRDIWTYVSMDYFKQKIAKNEVGSSAMPHKVNPIDFENAEGNLGVANALLIHLSEKLPISRLQRDLTDSTVLRNVGVPLSHMHIALHSMLKGIGKLVINESKIQADLELNWAVVAEGIQTVLRREGFANPYEALKELTRTNDVIDASAISKFIDTLDVKDEIKQELRLISPFSYTGI